MSDSFLTGFNDGYDDRKPPKDQDGNERSDKRYVNGWKHGQISREIALQKHEHDDDTNMEELLYRESETLPDFHRERFQIIPVLEESQNPFCPIFEVKKTAEGQVSVYISNSDDCHYGYTVQVKAAPADIDVLVSFADTLDQVTRDECKSPSEWYSKGVKDGLIRQPNPPAQNGERKLAYLDGYRDGQHNKEAQS